MSYWPTTLPAPAYSGYALQPAQSFQRTDMETGLPRQRSQFTDVPEYVNFTLQLDATQMVTFRDFWKISLNNGANAFDLPVIDLGEGFQTYQVRARAPYQAVPLPGMVWEVSMSIEVLNA